MLFLAVVVETVRVTRLLRTQAGTRAHVSTSLGEPLTVVILKDHIHTSGAIGSKEDHRIHGMA